MVWPALIAAGASIGAGFLSNAGSSKAARRQYEYQVQLMNHQYNLTRQLNKNAYQDTTYSMREAGINPMLAITQGINGLSAGSGGSVTAMNDTEAGLNASMAVRQMYNEKQRVENETDITHEQVKTNQTQQQVNQYTADLAHEQSASAREVAQREQMLNDFIKKDPERYFGAQLKVLDSQAIKNMIEAQNSSKYTSALINNLNADTGSKSSDKESKDIENKFSKEHPLIYGLTKASGAVPVVGAVAGGGFAAIHSAKSHFFKKKVGF